MKGAVPHLAAVNTSIEMKRRQKQHELQRPLVESSQRHCLVAAEVIATLNPAPKLGLLHPSLPRPPHTPSCNPQKDQIISEDLIQELQPKATSAPGLLME